MPVSALASPRRECGTQPATCRSLHLRRGNAVEKGRGARLLQRNIGSEYRAVGRAHNARIAPCVSTVVACSGCRAGGGSAPDRLAGENFFQDRPDFAVKGLATLAASMPRGSEAGRSGAIDQHPRPLVNSAEVLRRIPKRQYHRLSRRGYHIVVTEDWVMPLRDHSPPKLPWRPSSSAPASRKRRLVPSTGIRSASISRGGVGCVPARAASSSATVEVERIGRSSRHPRRLDAATTTLPCTAESRPDRLPGRAASAAARSSRRSSARTGRNRALAELHAEQRPTFKSNRGRGGRKVLLHDLAGSPSRRALPLLDR